MPLHAVERREALNWAIREIQADSARGPQASKLRTIHRFLACFNLRLVPFTVKVVYALGAALKWRKYRSADLYLYMARVSAERQGAVISRAAHRAVTDMIRSCRRGLGPSRRCEGLIMENLPSLPAAPVAWTPGGPWRPRAAITLGSWYMLREMEFSNAEMRSVTLNMVGATVTLSLPASKADPTALGATVTHGCCCLNRPGLNASAKLKHDYARSTALCPFHLALDHLSALHHRFPRRFDENGWAHPGYPLFTDADGGVCTKEGVASTIRAAAVFLGHPVRDTGGLYLHTGHALRVTGAQGLARAGLSEHQISLLARWGSSAVLRYIRTAPLASTHRMAAQVLAGWEAGGHSTTDPGPSGSSSSRLNALPTAKPTPKPKAGRRRGTPNTKQYNDFERRLAAVEDNVRALEAWRFGVAEKTEKASVSPAPEPLMETIVASGGGTEHLPYIVSGYNKWHEVFVGHPAHPCDWTATCGWRFGTSREAKATDVLPEFYKDMCERCFFSERASAKAVALTRVHEDG